MRDVGRYTGYEELPVGVVVCNVDEQGERIAYVNPAFCELFGGERDGLLATYANAPFDLIAPIDREVVSEKVRDGYRSHKPFSFACRYLRPDGHLLWLEAKANVIAEATGGSTVILTCADLDRIETTGRMSMMLNNLPNLAAVYHWNGTAMKLLYCGTDELGLSEVLPDIFSDQPQKLIYDVDALALRDLMQKAFQTLDTVRAVFRIKRDPVRWFVIRARLLDEGGGACRIYAAYADVTEQENARRSYRKVVSRLENTMEVMAGGFTVLRITPDHRTTVQYVNNGLCQMLGSTREALLELYGNDVFAGLHPDDAERVKRAIEHMEPNKPVMLSEHYRLGNERGEYKWMSVSLRSTQEADGSRLIYCSYTDIDETMRLQEKLALAQKRYEYAWSTSASGRWEYDVGRDLILLDPINLKRTTAHYPNAGFKAEMTIEEMLQTGAVQERSKDEYRKLHQQLRNGAEHAHACIWCTTGKGQPACYDISYSVMPINEGERIAMSVSVDVTKQKQLEENYINVLSKRTRGATTDGFVLDLTDGVCLSAWTVEPEWRNVRNIPLDDFLNGFTQHILNPDGREMLTRLHDRDTLMEAYQNGKGEDTITIKLDNGPDGRPRWYRVYCTYATDPNTDHVMIVGSSKDITDRQLEQAFLEKSVISNFDYVAIVDLKADTYRILGNNHALEALIPQTGRYSEACPKVTKAIVEYADQPANYERLSLENLRKQLEINDIYTFSFSHRDASGGLHAAQIQVFYVDRELDTVCLCRTDITEAMHVHQQQKQELATALSEAQRANRIKSEFLSRMSHEIRTPLNAVLGLALLGYDVADPGAQDYFKKIHSAGNYLLGIISDILDVSRIEQGKLKLVRAPVNRTEFLHALFDMVNMLAYEKNIRLLVDFEQAGEGWVMLDRQRTEQVYLNLINNAIKFSPAGSVVEWSIKDEPVDDKHIAVIVTVRDHGIGMSKEFQQRMFEPFEQEERAEANRGTGLGLPIVKSILDLAGGTIDVESELGKGTTITVRSVVETCEKPESDVEEHAIDELRFALSGGCVLVAEDNAINAEIVRLMLRRMGVDPICTVNGLEAVNAFERSEVGQFDAILMDVRMPVMDGVEATRVIRGMQRADAAVVPILALTADTFASDRESLEECGMDACVSKPFEPMTLYRTLAGLILARRGKVGRE